MINQETKRLFRRKLLSWYRDNARDLPWRRMIDPYSTWVSEIMLQQTRVDTVIPYYQRWMESFPTVTALANADEDQVLNLWEGLGYYRRAHNLLRAARIVADEYSGIIPKNLKQLQKLPGIGRYTSGAIASIAYGQNAPIIDGNIRRVLTRFFNINTPINERATENQLWNLAADLIPDQNPGDYNQALMELGATICVPQKPACGNCPLKPGCLALRHEIQEDRPVRLAKPPLPHLQVAAGVIKENNLVLVAKRPSDGLLGGLWEFPGGTQEDDEILPETLSRELLEELNLKILIEDKIGIFDHAYTHYRVTLHAFQCKLITREIKLNYHSQYQWAAIENLSDYPMGKLDRQIANYLQKENSKAGQ